MKISALQSVIAALQDKARDQNAPQRVWLLGCGGALNGAYLAGVQVALVEAKLHRAITGYVGVSTSIPAMGHLLTANEGEEERHRYLTTTYSVEARSRKFIRWNLRTDVRWLRSVFEGATGKPIRYQDPSPERARFIGVVTDWETGRPRYIEPQSREEFFTLIEAGCSIPGLAEPVLLQGRLSVDGVASDPCPVSWLMSLPEYERPTHILIIANAARKPPLRLFQDWRWQLTKRLFKDKVPHRIISGLALGHRRFRRKVKAAEARTDVVVAVDWLPWPQSPLNRNPRKIEALTQAGYAHFKRVIAESGT